MDTTLTDVMRVLEQIQQQLASPKDEYSSYEIKELYTALAKAQGEYTEITYNRENPYFKSNYADLHTIMQSVRPAMCKYGLGFLQQIRINDDGATMLHTRVTHTSGQWVESRMRVIPAKNDPQTFGSTLTYLRRYAAVSLLGITISHDRLDDDGEIATAPTREVQAKGTAPSLKYNPREQAMEVITKEQMEELEYELAEYPDLAEEIISKLQLMSLADMPKNKFIASIQRIREIKQLRSGQR